VVEIVEGAVFAGHRIQAVAGRGGMGVVYRARQLDLDRTVALKLIAPQLAQDDEFRERFLAESRGAAAIDHPNVIPIYYIGEAEDQLYIAMRYVEGDDLRTLVRREGGLPPARAAHIVSQVAAALDAAHARGLVHRDVKPANVLLDAGDHAYLTDFGLTKRLASAAAATRPGGWVGTLGYVAPEQIRGERIDARADVYALGCVLFHALTSRSPYDRDSDEATLWAHLNEPPPPLRSLAPGVPRQFEEVVDRALHKDPAARYPSAGDLGRAALAAAGKREALAPERSVARGTAAPVDVPTVGSPSVAPTQGVAPRRHAVALRRAGPAVAAVAVIAVAAAAALVLPGGKSDNPQPGSRPGAPEPAARVAATIPLRRRGNGITYAGGRVWVISFSSRRVLGVDARTDRATATVALPDARGTAAITAGFGSLWVANAVSQSVTRVSLATRRPGLPLTLPPGKVVALAAGAGGVWAGSRTGSRNPFLVRHVARIDPVLGTVSQTMNVPNGVQDLAVGAGFVWVLNRTKRVVTRIDVTAPDDRRNVPVGHDPQRITFGGGYVWVTNAADDTITRIRPHSLDTATIAVGNGPAGIAVGGDAVWVANRLDSTLTRVDPSLASVVGDPVKVGLNPSALVVHGHTVWVTSTGDGRLTRIEFR
jgi:hypothetical protein